MVSKYIIKLRGIHCGLVFQVKVVPSVYALRARPVQMSYLPFRHFPVGRH